METNKKCGIFTTYPKSKGDREGGLRTKGIMKSSTKEYPLITYITVVYNRVNTLLRCMESIWNQDYPNIEYIVIDGASTDGTLDIIEQNADKIDYYISQKDSGIYNAMNKGVCLASGQLICFMNSDDYCKPHAASKVAEIYKKENLDIICGSRELVLNGKRIYEPKYPRYSIKKSVFRYLQMFHQSTYATPEVFNKVGYFDENYSLLADWIWESTSIDAGFMVHFTDEELSYFSYDGASNQGICKRDKEWECWAGTVFPNLRKKDLILFIYCLDRGRHPLFDLKMLNKVAFKYFDNEDFVRTYYATVLLVCLEQCIDICDLKNESDTDFVLPIQDCKMCKRSGINNATELKHFLDNKLSTIYKSEMQKEDLIELADVRSLLNRNFYRMYLRKRKDTYSSSFDRISRIMCYTVSKMVSKSVLLSRKYYIVLRTLALVRFRLGKVS